MGVGSNPVAEKYLFKVIIKTTRLPFDICSNSTIETLGKGVK